MVTLDVTLYGEHIGVLERRGNGSVFEPTDLWRWNRFSPLLGLAWLEDPAPRHSTEGLPLWFDALLPDLGTPLRTRLSASAGVSDRDAFSLLAHVGADLPGAVCVFPRGATASVDDEPQPLAQPKGDIHFSLAGAQLKFSLNMRENKLVLPVHGQAGHFILKIPGQEFIALPSIEKTTMDWAALCGHMVPESRLVPIREIGELTQLEEVPGELALLVSRFDRTPSGPVHQEDFCQIFSIPKSKRYAEFQDGPPLGYFALVGLVRDACGEPQAIELTRRIAFALASGNTDAHLQNWSLQLPQSGGFRLAPLYDQVSVIALPRWGWDRDRGPGLALPLGGVRRMAEVTEAVVGRFARESGDQSLASAFMDALETASRAWPQVVASALAPHRRAVEEHWKRVPVLAGVGLGAS